MKPSKNDYAENKYPSVIKGEHKMNALLNNFKLIVKQKKHYITL